MSDSAGRLCPVCGAVIASAAGSCGGCGEVFAAARKEPKGPLSWPRAIAWSAAVVYGPFVAMATYMLLFVGCSHCKRTAWTILPWAPGLLPAELILRFLTWRPPEFVCFVLALGLSATFVLIFARVLRHRGWGRVVVCGLVLVVGSFLATILMAMIRA
jgi:hypothetical protein